MNTSTFPAHRYGFADDEWQALQLAASRSVCTGDFAARLGDFAARLGDFADLLADKGSPAGRVVGGRFDLLTHWVAEDRAFGRRLLAALGDDL